MSRAQHERQGAEVTGRSRMQGCAQALQDCRGRMGGRRGSLHRARVSRRRLTALPAAARASQRGMRRHRALPSRRAGGRPPRLEVVLVDGGVQVALVLQRLHRLPHLHHAVPPAAPPQHLRRGAAVVGGCVGGWKATGVGARLAGARLERRSRRRRPHAAHPPTTPAHAAAHAGGARELTSSSEMPASPCASGALKKAMMSACTAVSPPCGLYPAPPAPPAPAVGWGVGLEGRGVGPGRGCEQGERTAGAAGGRMRC